MLYEGSRATLIRNLSVFISYLESTVSPGTANYTLFQRASQVFSQILDEILEPELSITETELAESALLEFGQILSANGSDFFNGMDFGVAVNEWLV